MPDFDIDFCQTRRDEVIAYVRRRYGTDRVAQIITFGSFLARGVLRNVGRVLEMPLGQVDKLAKLVPQNPANPVTLAQAIESEPKLQEAAEQDGRVARLLTIARSLEGLYSNASTHAAGIVIGDRPLHEIVPLYRDPKSDMPATQFNMKWVEPAGLVKFDFLGLKTLTVIETCLKLLASRHDRPSTSPPSRSMMRRPMRCWGAARRSGYSKWKAPACARRWSRCGPTGWKTSSRSWRLYRPGPHGQHPHLLCPQARRRSRCPIRIPSSRRC